ncbi:kinetochore protein Spc24 [Suncus etruscus]|uniref:kinetochore protein Spc24 n=1 Tax=Suncus etruscus TaxID=109475 RepID=UPI00210F79C5|nr:kinetochore protein Spc24 [Suncus etruscus]
MAAFRDMEDVSQGLLSLLAANRAEVQHRRLLALQERMVERLLRTQDEAERRLLEIAAAEEDVAKNVLVAQSQAQAGRAELKRLQTEMERASQEDTQFQNRMIYLLKELDELKAEEAEMARREKEMEEDSTVTLPVAVHVAQLYNHISKIEWDYEAEPNQIRGIHHGPDVAQPIELDALELSGKFVSDYLWGLLNTEW